VPAEPGPEISEPGVETERGLVIAEAICGSSACSCRIFPFTLGWQPVRFAGSAAQPRRIAPRLVPVDAHHRLLSCKLETRPAKRCIWRTPRQGTLAKIDDHMARIMQPKMICSAMPPNVPSHALRVTLETRPRRSPPPASSWLSRRLPQPPRSRSASPAASGGLRQQTYWPAVWQH
jgi:hypothetical protein